MEIWKPVKGYEENYLVSDEGRIMNSSNGKVLSPIDNGYGYKKIWLWKNHKGKRVYVHRIVADAFLPNKYGRKEVNHIDSNPSNNCVTNLEWVSSSENTKHAVYKKSLKPWGNQSKPIEAIDIATGTIKKYATISEAERDIGSRHITDVLKGKRYQCKGYTFHYIEGGDACANFDYRQAK